MLRITQQDNAKAAKQYYSHADYLSEGQEIVGSWGGEGARKLGLAGTVDQLSFDRLCDNLNPLDGKQLTARTRSDRTVGYDFTFSVPKSVSLLHALSGDRQLLDAFREAVDETMRDIEVEMKARVRKGGKDAERGTGNMVWAEFVHTTSRPVDGVPDPQLHAHVFVFNATWDDTEQQWKAGQFRDLKRDAPYFQAAFRVRLANKLQDLGFGVERTRDDFELIGIPPELLKRFSRRTEEVENAYEQLLAKRLAKRGHGEFRAGKLTVDGVEQSREQILEASERLGITDPRRKAELGAETREKKDHESNGDQLRKAWDRRLTHEERSALAETHRRETPHARPERGEGLAVDYALAHSFAREAVVPERKLLTEALKRGVGAVTVEGVQRELARRPLVRAERAGRMMTTTHEAVSDESRLIDFARRGRYRPLGNPERPCRRDWFNEGQKAAVRHVLGSRDVVTIVRGAAGTGKTTLEQEIGEALAEAERPVLAIAQSTDAVHVLRTEAGFDGAVTVARFFKDTEMQERARGGVILLDEASQVGTTDMLRLFDLARDAGARLVLVGDRRQHRSVSAGEPLKLLEERAGLPVAEVTEILRQSGHYKKAAQFLSAGRVAEGFAELDQLGWIREVPDAERDQALARAYLTAIAEKKKGGAFKSALVVSPTHAEAARITHTIRAALKEQGKLGEDRTLRAWVPTHFTGAQKGDATNYEPGDLLQFHQNAPGHPNGSRLVVAGEEKLPLQHADRFEVYRPVSLALAVGDRVRVTANGKTKDGKHVLRNGSLYTVNGFTPQGDLVIDHRWVIARDFGHLAHGYVVTSHASQGRTVDKVFIGQSSLSFPATNRRSFYVPVTRGKEQAVIFTDDKQELLRAAERPDEPLSATELVRSGRRPPAPRPRLHKHLARVRRFASFARMHEPLGSGLDRTQTSDREMGHAR